MSTIAQAAKADRLRALHRAASPLVLINVWDAASAAIVARLGFPAIATSSAGVANALGYADGQRVPRELMLDALARIVRVVDLPVSADLERGYGDRVEDAVASADGAIAAGAVGINIEDGENEGERMLPMALQAERIRAIAERGRQRGVRLVVNARTDAYWSPNGTPQSRFDDTVARARAYVAAGADCIFVPGASEPAEVGALARAIDAPLNILANASTPPIAKLAELGVRRVSLGSGAMGVTLRALRDLATEVRDGGSFAALARRIPYAELNAMFES